MGCWQELCGNVIMPLSDQVHSESTGNYGYFPLTTRNRMADTCGGQRLLSTPAKV